MSRFVGTFRYFSPLSGEKVGYALRQHPLSEVQNLTINVTQRRHPMAAGRPGGNRERRGALPAMFPHFLLHV